MNRPPILPAANPASTLRVASLLREGGVAVVPTDTLYGLAASVFNEDAVRRVYAVKRRPPEKRVPVLLGSAAELTILAAPPPRVTWKLIDAFWPGALTLVLAAGRSAPKSIARNTDTVALRVPGSRSCLELLQSLGEPIVGTSANRSGEMPARTAREVAAAVPEVDAVLEDDSTVRLHAPSTVVKVTEGKITILRAGVISAEQVRGVVGAAMPVEEDSYPPSLQG